MCSKPIDSPALIDLVQTFMRHVALYNHQLLPSTLKKFPMKAMKNWYVSQTHLVANLQLRLSGMRHLRRD